MKSSKILCVKNLPTIIAIKINFPTLILSVSVILFVLLGGNGCECGGDCCCCCAGDGDDGGDCCSAGGGCYCSAPLFANTSSSLEALQKSNSKQLNLGKCDIFSLGLTLYVCATNREMPKQGNEWQQLRLNIIQYLHTISHCSMQFNELILGRMCNVDPNQRPSAYEVSFSFE
ncbi:unnamed protein product [Adineta steineri]|uniref:Protein kinase domain-containing protein n=1 Tax=Adineta steineri TaxID=433720 RepID=A0A814XE87_9BILA|nr:unnamed protein product [Adineta steineri]